MGLTLARPVEEEFRKIDVLWKGVTPSPEQQRMADNSVVTAKYNILTFVPRSLFEQFRRVANVYFLVISILMVIGTYTTLFTSPLTPWSTLIPLVFVLLITMVKDGAEDLKRHRSDNRVNSTAAQVLDMDERGRINIIEWKDVKVGMILKVEDREEIPADLVLIASSESGGVGYIETANIDGETNLKIRTCAPTRVGQPPGPAWSNEADMYRVPMKLEYEPPNPRIHFYTGTLTVGGSGGGERRDEEAAEGELGIAMPSGMGETRDVPVDQSNLLLRGSRLRNTKWVLGIVAYTGRESKIAQNARAPPSKQSNLDKVTNKIMLVIFISMAAVTTFSLIGYLIFSAEFDSKLYYLCYDISNAPVPLFANNCEDQESSSDVGQWFTFLILYNNFIPISLYVTLEMVNYFHASFIDEDLEMYDEGQDTPAQARSANMSADLGQIEYVFSDKTGTLTQNLMKFKRCSVAGNIWGEIDDAAKALLTPAQLQRVVDAPPLSSLAGLVRDARMHTTMIDFALCLALNHTVVLETDPKTGQKQMQAESPDEEALVDGAKMLGVDFTDRGPGKVFLDVDGKGKLEYSLVVTIPFNSTRKRMSVVLQAPDGSYILYCKGADNIIMDRAKDYADTTKATIEEHLSVFSNDGLRTLLLARREFSKSFFEDWHSRYKTASIATTDRAEQIATVAKEVEVELTVIGATAIEDKLQDEVPQTIADLRKAGVKVWVLTGDKMETAINIGYSCRLLEPDMTLIKLKERKGEPDSVQQQLRSLVKHFEKLGEDDQIRGAWDWGRARSRGQVKNSGNSRLAVDEAGGLPEPLLERPEGAPDLAELSSDSLALILDGPSLAQVLGHREAESMLLSLGSMCRSVVACRVSPAQKRLIVRLVKRGVVPKPVTLSIGDGANDVGMIQEAQIGVGISGKEGRQAVNNADFAIAQFRFLKRLMLVHGHWDYRRMCKVILYSFYKNIVLSFTLFYFCFYSGFSGQSLYETYVYSGFNWFLAMPILCTGLFDRDVEAEVALKCHRLYAVGRDGMDLNIKVMTKWVIQALLDSLVVFFLPLNAYDDPSTVWAERGYADGLYVFGTTVYSCLIMAMMLKAFNVTMTWTGWNFLFWWGSLAFYIGFISLYAVILYFYDFYWVAFQLMSRATFWLLLFQVPAVTWAVDVFIRMVEHMFFPTVAHHAAEFNRGLTDESGRKELENIKKRERERRGPLVESIARGVSTVQEMPGPKRDHANRVTVPQHSLRALNDGVGEDQRQELGITEGREGSTRSSYAFDHVTADFGIGASVPTEELRNLIAVEGEERVRHARSRSTERFDSSFRLELSGPDGTDSAAGSRYDSEDEQKV